MIWRISLLTVEWFALPWWLFLALPKWGMSGRNFKGSEIPVGFGIFVVVWSITALILLRHPLSLPFSMVFNWMILLAGFGGLGFLDDAAGSRSSTGLRGHLHTFIQHRRITTGLIKAVGGVGLALFLSYRAHDGGVTLILLNCLLIALTANAINLLDLRPGRAGAVFCVLSLPFWIPSMVILHLTPISLLMPAMILLQWYDSRGKVMMGDSGSNALGAALGYAFVTSSASTLFKCIVCLILVGMHLLAEKVSFSNEIEKIGWLRKLDSLTGIR